MMVVMGIFGALGGWLLLSWVDYLPRFSPNFSSTKRQEWDGLRFFVPLLGAALMILLYATNGFSSHFLVLAMGCAYFLLIALIDLKYRLVLNLMTYPAIILVILAGVLGQPDQLLPILLGGGFAFGIFYLTALLRPGDLGMGDVKLAALLGVLFGFPNVLYALLIGGGVGAAVALFLLLRQHGTKFTMPYAPFLCVGAVVVLLYV